MHLITSSACIFDLEPRVLLQVEESFEIELVRVGITLLFWLCRRQLKKKVFFFNCLRHNKNKSGVMNVAVT